MKHLMLKRLGAGLLSLLLLTGCSGQTEVMPEPEADSLISPEEETLPEKASFLPAAFALPYDPALTLDPITCRDGTQQVVSSLLYESLFRLNEVFEPVPWLCSSYTYDEEMKVYTLQLREGVLFSDGTPLTANDVEESLDRARDSVRYGGRLSSITRVEPENDTTLTITLSEPNLGLPALLDIPIVKDGTQKDPVPVGTGPYLFSADESGAYLARNRGWWWDEALPVDRISLVEAADQDTLLYRFSSHDVQLMTADLTGTGSISATGNTSFRDANTTILQYLGCNTERAPLNSAAFRRLLSSGINRSRIVSGFLSGHGAAAQFPISPASPLYPAALEEHTSSDAFRAALEASGYTAERPLTLLVNEENTFKLSVAQYLAESFTESGVPMEVRPLPWEEYLTALETGDFDLYYGEVKLSADWDLSPLLSGTGALNYGNWVNAAIDDLLRSFASSVNRADAMAELCAFLKLHAPILPLCFKSTSVLVQTGVVDGLAPTMTEPFYNFTACTVHLADS